MNVLYSTNNRPITNTDVQKSIELLEQLGHQIDRYEHGMVSIMQKYEDNVTKYWDVWKVEFYTDSDISVDDGCKLWENGFLDGSASLTFVNEKGELIWRES